MTVIGFVPANVIRACAECSLSGRGVVVLERPRAAATGGSA